MLPPYVVGTDGKSYPRQAWVVGMKRLTVVHVNSNLTYVSGYGAREMYSEIKGRPPVWSSLGRAWCMQPHTAADLIALAESRGYSVVVLQDDPLPAYRGQLW